MADQSSLDADEMHELQSLERISAQFGKLSGAREELETKVNEYRGIMRGLKARQGELQGLSNKCKLTVRETQRLVDKACSEASISAHQKQLFLAKLLQMRLDIRRLTEVIPRTGSSFLYALMGKVNVVIEHYGDRFDYKEKYEHFKRNMTYVLIVLSVTALWLPGSTFVDFLIKAFMMYYYTTMLIRETVLKVNGSNIRPWWTIHHYTSLLFSFVHATWPTSSASYQKMHFFLCTFLLYLAVVQLLQFRYQLRRLYTLRALGRARETDVTTTDVGGVRPGTFMNVLMPFLLAVQAFQMYNSYLLFTLAFEDEYWQPFVIAVLFAVLGIGNFIMTVRTFQNTRKTPAHISAPPVSADNAPLST